MHDQLCSKNSESIDIPAYACYGAAPKIALIREHNIESWEHQRNALQMRTPFVRKVSGDENSPLYRVRYPVGLVDKKICF